MAFGMHRETPLVNLFANNGRSRRGKLDFQSMADGFVGKTDWTIHEAYLGVLVSTALADRTYHDEEQAEILRLGRRSRVLSQLSVPELAAANDKVNERFEKRPDALREACQALPREMRPSVFGHCVEIALSDGELHPSEIEHLQELVQLMDLDHDQAHNIVDVLLLTNRY